MQDISALSASNASSSPIELPNCRNPLDNPNCSDATGLPNFGKADGCDNYNTERNSVAKTTSITGDKKDNINEKSSSQISTCDKIYVVPNQIISDGTQADEKANVEHTQPILASNQLILALNEPICVANEPKIVSKSFQVKNSDLECKTNDQKDMSDNNQVNSIKFLQVILCVCCQNVFGYKPQSFFVVFWRGTMH